MHNFTPSLMNKARCALCHFTEIDHTERATCEACGNTGKCELYVDMLLCLSCYGKEIAAQKELKETAEDRVKASRELQNQMVEQSRKIDHSIQVSQDLFNAKMIAIADLAESISKDESIPNKHFALARVLDEKFTHLQNVITEANQAIKDSQNEIRAIQTYYNDLAKKLREEEREQIRIRDAQYRPPEKKIVTKPKAPSIKKFDKGELKRAADEISKEFPKIPSSLILPNLQSIVIQRQVSIEAAKNILKGMFS